MASKTKRTPQIIDFGQTELNRLLEQALSIIDENDSPNNDDCISFNAIEKGGDLEDLPAEILRKILDDVLGALASTSKALDKLTRVLRAYQLASQAAKPLIAHSVRITKNGLPNARRKHKDDAQARYSEIAAEVESVMRANWPYNTLTYARQQVASSRGISFGTVRTATRGMKGPGRKAELLTVQEEAGDDGK